VKPLLCSASVVRNLLNSKVGAWPAEAIDSSKPFQWQDRRPLSKKDQPRELIHDKSYRMMSDSEWLQKNAPIKRGDVLYVRETLRESNSFAVYSADGSQVMFDGNPWYWRANKNVIPSIHMQKSQSRIHLEVMRVRVERACDISEEDALAEGMPAKVINGIHSWPSLEFKTLWQSLYGQDAWEKWVWVYDLKRIK
jgi:hypothetical protein